MGWSHNPAFMRYGETWKASRRVLHQLLHEAAAKRYIPQQTRHNVEFLRNLLQKPQDFYDHVRLYVKPLRCYISTQAPGPQCCSREYS